MTTTDRIEKVVRQWQNGFLTLPDLICQLTEIDYLSIQQAKAAANPNACSGGVCTTIDNLCSRHQMQYQDKYGRASNE